jgi:hypothetical protein
VLGSNPKRLEWRDRDKYEYAWEAIVPPNEPEKEPAAGKEKGKGDDDNEKKPKKDPVKRQ